MIDDLHTRSSRGRLLPMLMPVRVSYVSTEPGTIN